LELLVFVAKLVPGAGLLLIPSGFTAVRVRPSPSRHIYNPLTIAIAFARLVAFDRVWQHLVKVDGTFA
jgi:hypothetical protein